MLTSWEQQEPKLLYQRQLEITKSKARTVQREIEHLRHTARFQDIAAAPEGGELSADEQLKLAVKKLEFLSAEMSVYTHVVKLVVAQAAKIDLEDIRRDLSQSKADQQVDFFLEACRLLQLMEHAFDSVLLAPLDSFSLICGEFKRSLNKMVRGYHPQAAAATGLVAGGVFTIVVHGLATGACTVMVPVLGGTLVALAALVGLCAVADYLFGGGSCSEEEEGHFDEEGAPERVELQRIIEHMEEQEMLPKSLEELREVFERCFGGPMQLSSPRALLALEEDEHLEASSAVRLSAA